MPKSITLPSIGTWPEPEQSVSGFRFEGFFLDQLGRAKRFDRLADLNARFRLNMEAIMAADRAGYFVDRVPEQCEKEPRPAWCLAAGGIIIEGRILMIESLIANGALDSHTRLDWHAVARNMEFGQFAPTLLRHLTVKNCSGDRALELLDRSFAAASGAAYPVPGSDLERYCREHPDEPICQLIAMGYMSNRARSVALEIVLVSLLHSEHIVTDKQTRAFFDAAYAALTPRRGAGDLSLSAAVIILDALHVGAEGRDDILGSMAINRLGLVDPDSPLADACLKEDPPPHCRFMRRFPMATAFTSELIKHRLWVKADALDAWDRLRAMWPTIDTVPLPEGPVGPVEQTPIREGLHHN